MHFTRNDFELAIRLALWLIAFYLNEALIRLWEHSYESFNLAHSVERYQLHAPQQLALSFLVLSGDTLIC